MKGGCFEKGTYSVDGRKIIFHSSAYNTDATVTMSRDDKGTSISRRPTHGRRRRVHLLLQDLEEDRVRAAGSAQVAPSWRGISAVNRVSSPITLRTANVPPGSPPGRRGPGGRCRVSGRRHPPRRPRPSPWRVRRCGHGHVDDRCPGILRHVGQRLGADVVGSGLARSGIGLGSPAASRGSENRLRPSSVRGPSHARTTGADGDRSRVVACSERSIELVGGRRDASLRRPAVCLVDQRRRMSAMRSSRRSAPLRRRCSDACADRPRPQGSAGARRRARPLGAAAHL